MTDTAGRRRYSRVVGAQRDELVDQIEAAYKGGASIREITQQTGCSYGTVHRILTRETDVQLRSRGGKPAAAR